MTAPLINADRLWARLMALAEIGATPAGGVNRQALSDGEIAAWRLVIDWAHDAGLTAETDAAGNLFLTLAGRDRAAPPILLGSHLDSQPTGGKFDGAVGVLAALEAVASLAAQGKMPACDLIVVAWMNEEGSRFAPGMMGSEIFVGERGIEAIRAVRDANDISVGEALDRLHAAFPGLPRKPLGFPAAAYLELHIEQGPLLEAAGRVIGIVTGIQGKKTFQVAIEGTEGHAGTLRAEQASRRTRGLCTHGDCARRRDRLDRRRDQVHDRPRDGRAQCAVGGAVARHLQHRLAAPGQCGARCGRRTNRRSLP